MIRMNAVLALLQCLFAALSFAQPTPEGRLMRFPDVAKDKIVFSYGGDLWLVSRDGGTARRVTSHPGQELFGKFSPDGKWIAFTAQYDGNYNVYVMPSEGGEPKQLTFHPGGDAISERMGIQNEVITWTPDSKHIVYLTRRDTFNDWFGRLYSVSLDGGLPEPLPLDKGGLTSYSPDGSKIAYNRIFRNFRMWKRYQGGMAQDISIYDFKSHALEVVPHEDWTDTFPMWRGDTIYFDSDRGPEHRLNLYSYSLTSRQIKQLTHFTEFDVNWPSLGPDAIVFENGGYVYLFDLATQQSHKLTIYLPGDRDLARKRWTNVSKLVTDFDIAPDGKRGVLTARGDIFTVPAKEGSIRNLTRTPGIREKYAAWSPDGRWVAYISDRTGEDELYMIPQDGSGPEVRITFDGKMFRMPPLWSPDSTKLAFADKATRLFYVDVTQKKPVEIDHGVYGEITDYNWSPDSHWVAYAKPADNRNPVVYLYGLVAARSTPVTTSASASANPCFDPEGKYLYFISNRDYNEVLGVYDFEFANPKASRVYLATLRADLPSPFQVLSDEVMAARPPDVLVTPTPGTPPPVEPAQQTSKPKPSEASPTPSGGPKAKGESAAEPEPGKRPPLQGFRVDLDGIGNRIVALPTPPGNLQNLAAARNLVLYVVAPVQGLSGTIPGESFSLHAYDLKDRKDHVLLAGADGFALSFDGKKLLYAAPKEGGGGGGEEGGGGPHTYGIIDVKVPSGDAPSGGPPIAKPLANVGDGALKLEGMRMELDPPAEWTEIFNEVWRQQRDYFFEPAMNGVNWQQQREKYAQLLPYVADRLSLTYVLGDLIGELSNSHTYTGGGDYPDLDPVNVGLLGADFAPDKESGYYRIAKIYPGENWNSALRSPLTEPGVLAKEGDYLLAVNGRPLKVPQNPEELFVNTVNQAVTLSLNSKPSAEGAHNVVVRPIPSEYGLHELNWIETNRRRVEKMSGGRIGYVYLPNMGAEGLNEFVKQYFPQIRKEGMVFDVRYNGGGFVDQLIFERLRRVLAGMESARNWESDTVPSNVFYGHMACVTNHYAASDGDFFSYFFKVYKLGPLVGERTWGGVRGIRGYIPLIDGGYVTRPEFSLYGLDSQWLIENRGVQPDIVIDNTPDQVMAGHDPQLEKAVELVMQEINAHPKKLPPRPPDLPAYPTGPGL
ncbi:MAG TPA: PDZ domain-containing protein [Candidatus Bathyarchaeia archaeon]|nr:PDZ domain-containing protein [Candidatus Bathyarchaeia archaeon]